MAATTTTAPPVVDFGVLPGKFGLAARLYNPTRDVQSGMSKIITEEFKAGRGHFAAPALDASPPKADGFTDVQTFRTTSGAARLFQEAFWKPGETPLFAATLGDEGLEYQPLYEPLIDEVRRPPTSRRIAYYDGVMLAEDAPLRAIRYSPTDKHQPEIFNSFNVSRVPSKHGALVEFVAAGDYLFALFPSIIRRYAKLGTVCTENDLHEGYGPISRSACVALSSGILYLSQKGLVAVPYGGAPQLYGSVNRLFVPQLAGSWNRDVEADFKSPLPNIVSAVDDLMGCAIFVNRAKQQAIVYWTDAQQRISLLEDWPWTLACSRSDPVRGGARRAWFHGMEIPDSPDTSFAAHNDKVWTIDAVLQADTQTMMGLSAGQVLNGAATGASASGTTLTRAGAGWTDEVVGAFVHVFDGYGADAVNRRRSRVVAASSSALTLYPPAGPIAVGDEFHVSCVPLVIADTALLGDGPNTDLSFRRVSTDMNVCLGPGCPPTPGSFVRLAMVGLDGAVQAEKAVPASLDFDETHAYLNAQDRALFPRWSSYWSDAPLELLQARIKLRKGESDVNG